MRTLIVSSCDQVLLLPPAHCYTMPQSCHHVELLQISSEMPLKSEVKKSDSQFTQNALCEVSCSERSNIRLPVLVSACHTAAYRCCLLTETHQSFSIKVVVLVESRVTMMASGAPLTRTKNTLPVAHSGSDRRSARVRAVSNLLPG